MKQNWLPDWKNESSYPDYKTTSLEGWAWEFLRRNSKYQKDYKKFKKLGDESLQGEKQKIFIDESGKKSVIINKYQNEYEHSTTHISTLGYFLNKYSLEDCPDLPNPEMEFKEQWTFIFFQKCGLTWYKYHEKNPNGLGLLPQRKEEIAVLLYTDTGLDTQIKRIRQVFKEIKTPLKNINNKKKDYANYLRVLDALTAKTEINEIAKIIFPTLNNNYPEYTGKKKVEQFKKSAENLRDYAYKFIPHLKQ